MRPEYIKEVLRLWYGTEHNRNEIANALGISHPSVTRVIKLAQDKGGKELIGLGDAELLGIFYPRRPGRPKIADKVEIDCGKILGELSRRSVTRQLLYEEYCDNYGERAFSYSVFCARLAEHENSEKLAMRLDHKPADVLYLDYCGDVVPIYDRASHSLDYEAQIFVATLAASGYSFFEAHRNQDAASFVAGVTRTFAFIGGVVETLVPDNLKAGVITNNKSDLKLSRPMVELCAHYQLFVEPARKYRARDKAKVEERVGFVQRHALAALRNEKFYSLEELNAALVPLREAINAKPFTKMPTSRAELFEKERGFLRPLPLLPFSYGTWKALKVPPNYHIDIAHCSYSVPNQLRNKTVDVRIGQSLIEVFFAGEHVASHPRSHTPGQVITAPAHLHPSHRQYLEGLDRNQVLAEAGRIGGATAAMAERIMDTARFGESGLASVRRLLRLALRYGPADLEKACAWGITIGSSSRSSIASILGSRAYEAPLYPEPPSFAHEHLRPAGYFAGKGASPCPAI